MPHGKTIIVVTHDEKVALSCQRILKISDGELCGDVERLGINLMLFLYIRLKLCYIKFNAGTI